MKKRSKKILSHNLGFTLVELLISMTLVGILVTLIGGNYITVKKKARDAQRKHDLEQIQRALEMYYNDYGEYPDSADLPAAGDPWQDASGTLYIKTWPPDPKGYLYWYETDNASYKLFAYLENDQDPNRQQCIIDMGNDCCPPDSCICSYGVSSVNLGICD